MALISMRDYASGAGSPEAAAGAKAVGMEKCGNRSGGTGLSRGRGNPAAYSMLLVSVVMAITVSALIQPLNANPTCILNCAQCVKIYGDYFDGHTCARVCLDSRSKFDSFVDCADPTTIARFLKTF
ncbi:Eclosion hormone [Orchesella cincta]|uniref:Eclosion hormone n=1 Tax=Orchesella cincta TaxID=48709 RepID=A0A1D2MDM6_ORCCI|nr:Eclosion hormone [Orchesella cincta]